METKNGFFIKDLRIIRNRDINRMLIVDNLTHSFGLQLDQGVVILEYHNDPNDKELLYIADYLIEAANAPNMLQFNKEKQNFDALAEAEIS